MPEIKHNFTGGKMNKDVDQRLVPKGEYRDAMNIQVSTSEGSDVGTVQNILGNQTGCNDNQYIVNGSPLSITNNSTTVGSVTDEKTDSLYWFVSGGQPQLSPNSTMRDSIWRHSSNGDCRPVFVDNYGISLTNPYNDTFSSSTLTNITSSVFGELEVGWTVVGIANDGTFSNTATISSFDTSPYIPFDFGFTPTTNTVNVETGVGLHPTIDVASNLGVVMGQDLNGNFSQFSVNYVYLFGWSGGNVNQLVGDTIEIPDSSGNTYVINAASTVSLSFTNGSGIQAVKLTLNTNLAIFSNPPLDPNLIGMQLTNGMAYVTQHDGSPITARITSLDQVTTDIANGEIIFDIGDYDVTNATPGSIVTITNNSSGFQSGADYCVQSIDSSNNSITLEDCQTGTIAPQGFQVGGAVYSQLQPTGGVAQFAVSGVVELDQSLDLVGDYQVLYFQGPRTLNFNYNTLITGINIIDDMLFWTDGVTEPKKINITRSIEGTFINGNFHTQLINPAQNISYGSGVLVKEEHVTVIRKAPLKPPFIKMDTITGETGGISDNSNTSPFDSAVVGGIVDIRVLDVDGSPLNFNDGDVLRLSGYPDELPANWDMRVKIQSQIYDAPTSTVVGQTWYTVKVESIVPDADLTHQDWYLELESVDYIFERKLPRFAYRYKYADNEYSSFSPFTQAAFVAGQFNYEPIKAYNIGMTNKIKSLTIMDFIPEGIPLDVVSVDILYKNEINPSIHLLKTVFHTDDSWQLPGSVNSDGASRGSYVVSSENISATLPSNQLLRSWDNVPKKALAQEITGNRVVYGNYEHGYDSITPQITASLDSRLIDVDANKGEKSIKSLRNYDIGVVWGDKYGRETPVKTAGNSIYVSKAESIASNYLKVGLENSPEWADYYRFYVKETSNEYYNLAVDRVYDAGDGNKWVSFPSVDRNKVDEDTYLILKKGVESSDPIAEEARYKIVAIENEAPEYIKTTFERLVRTNTDASRPQYSCNMFGGSNNAPCSLPTGGRNAPTVGMKGFSISSSFWLREYSIINNPPTDYLGMSLTSPKTLLDEVSGNTSGSTTDELYVSFSKETTDDGVTTVRPSKKYHVVNVSDEGIDSNLSGFFYINLDTQISSEDEWVTENISAAYPTNKDNIHIHFWKKTIINKPEFDGRFFVKILSDSTIETRLQVKKSIDNNLMVVASTSLYKIEDNSVAANNFLDGDTYLFNTDVGTPTFEVAPSAVNTDSSSDWNTHLKFGGSSTTSNWFIDRATFASKQQGTAPVESYSNVDTTFTDSTWGTRRSCDTTSFLNQSMSGNCGYLGTLTYDVGQVSQYLGLNIDETIGDGKSNGQVAMKGVHQSGSSDKYIDISYAQLGPTGSTGNTTSYNLDWRVGEPGNSSTDQEALVVSQLKTDGKFRLKGSDVVYRILGTQKFRLFNYQGKRTVGYATQSSSICNSTFWNNQQSVQTTAMADQRNRRLTYRIRYEVDEVFSPSGTTVDAIDSAGEPYHNISGTSAVALEFLVDFTTDGENPISSDPAIFETEPKEEVDIDIYYEASSSIPTFPITNKNKHLLVPIGSTILQPPSFFVNVWPEGVFITSWEEIDPSSPSYTLNLSTPVTPSQMQLLANQDVTYIEKDNGELVGFVVTGGPIAPIETFSGSGVFVNMVVAINVEFKNEIGLNWFNCWSFNNGVESNRIGDTYNKPHVTNGVVASSSTEELQEKEHRKYGLIYSGIYNSTSGINNLNQFIAAEKITKDINPIYGSIQKLHSGWGQGGDLVALCEDRILKILANKDALYNADGNSNVTSTNNVLGQAIPYSGEYGISKNPESFASEAYRIYFTDKVRGTVMRLSMDGLTSISNHGMKDWFRDNLKLGDKLIGSYDDRKDEYNITIKGSTIAKTVTFREDVKGWVSFKSFTPENAISCANEYYTFKDGNIWKHHDESVDRNTFYGIGPASQDPNTYSHVEVIFNEVPGSVKSFKTINYEGSQAKVTSKDEDGVTLMDGEYFNLSDVDGWHVTNVITNLEHGGITEFVEKEGKWFGYVIGNDVTVNPIGNVSGNYDTEDFSIQGIGRTASMATTIVFGCMDPDAFNYNDAATNGDGSCIDFSHGCMDPDADNFQASANTDDGSCLYYGCTTGPLAVWSQEAAGGSLNYDANANYDDGSCIPGVWGCTDPVSFNYNSAANLGSAILSDGTMCGYVNCMCIPIIPGCTDPNANNYITPVNEMTDVNVDDGSCEYLGCTDPIAENYSFADSCTDPIALTGCTVTADSTPYLNGTAIDDQSCTYVGGCMDNLACNYDDLATQDNGLCYFCGDDNAINYDAVSPFTDYICVGTCEYCNDVVSVTVISQTTADTGMSNGTVTIEWPASTSSLVTSYEIIAPGSGTSNYHVTPTGNATETTTITGLAAGTYTIYVGTHCGGLIAGINLPSGNVGTPTYIGTPVSTTITATPVPGCTDDTGANNNAGGTWGACNYDATATVDDGTCEYTTCTGCNDNAYLEYCGDCWDTVNQVVVASGGSAWVADTIPTSCTTFIVYGCTDATALNYDATATVDDGSCVMPIYGCMDATLNNDGTYAASNYAGPGNTLGANGTEQTPVANTDDGSCNPYNCPSGLSITPLMTGGYYTLQFSFDIANTIYSNASQFQGGPYDFTVGYDVVGGNGNPIAFSTNTGGFSSSCTTCPLVKTIGANQINNWVQGQTSITLTFTVDSNDGLCSVSETATFTVGCMDSTAYNYNSSFQLHDQSQCVYAGCTDPLACNYNAGATVDDGSCTYPGCTDSTADNYDSSAGCDDGSCVIYGCMDATLNADGLGGYAADNYYNDPNGNAYNPNVTAPCDDGTGDNDCCVYSGDPGVSSLASWPPWGNDKYTKIRALGENTDTAYSFGVVSTVDLGVSPNTGTLTPNPGIFVGNPTGATFVNGTQPFTNYVEQADWVPYVDINNSYGVNSGDLTITYHVYWTGTIDNPSMNNTITTNTVNNPNSPVSSAPFVLTAGCKDDSEVNPASAVNYEPALDLHIDGSCVAAQLGCMDPTATNYDADNNLDCSEIYGPGTETDCCCYTCDVPTFDATSPVVVNTWNDPNLPEYATQIEFNFAVVDTAVSYAVYVATPGQASFTTLISTLILTPAMINNGVATWVYNSPFTANSDFFQNETTNEFAVIATCENVNGDSCGTATTGWLPYFLNANP